MAAFTLRIMFKFLSNGIQGPFGPDSSFPPSIISQKIFYAFFHASLRFLCVSKGYVYKELINTTLSSRLVVVRRKGEIMIVKGAYGVEIIFKILILLFF